ncbi:hypothetical protein GGTG_08490 [Gaeumannomyces tritici R3-111a-1]|uniref:Uncharacterized protein n=1 Tax=Gaeumannomyces tritici (strain R3-111a-1) TaxID=644352 RepID=J3P4Q3_GAET3|nr:hypothetical protein GGTG_08490 [Gaeumannomyces tritici R3-111a-1]EJT74650.1 hypothetical protein GGTG_08490 [Gaeumannomyces tritici R3-111a-1]
MQRLPTRLKHPIPHSSLSPPRRPRVQDMAARKESAASRAVDTTWSVMTMGPFSLALPETRWAESDHIQIPKSHSDITQ